MKRYGKYGRNPTWILKSYGLWKKSKLNSEKLWKYRGKVSWKVKIYGNYGGKVSWIVKRYGNYGRKASWIVKWYWKYGRFLC